MDLPKIKMECDIHYIIKILNLKTALANFF